MKKNDCNVVRDLMPLVIDRAASDESREFVEAHIAGCAECREGRAEGGAEKETEAPYPPDRADRALLHGSRAARPVRV